MNFPTLKDTRVTTMVVIVGFEPVINIDVLFPLLDWADFEPIVKTSKKINLPKLKSGSLISGRYDGVVLGNVIYNRPTFFKNSIITDIFSCGKKISVKISKEKFQMCGTKSKQMAEETSLYLFEHFRKAAELFEFVTESDLDAALHYVKNQDETVLEGHNENIMYKLLSYALRCKTMEKFEKMIENLRKFIGKPFLSASPAVINLNEAMINYMFSLGFRVSRINLAKSINGLEEFFASFDNTLNHSVTIEHPHKVLNNKKKKKSKGHPYCASLRHRDHKWTESNYYFTHLRKICKNNFGNSSHDRTKLLIYYIYIIY